ncbi:hypothetical protein BC829DRAFT_18675 [Chytridium lagenaria]|nr:hypothetical protein BC829DRAFT_18675 [Chytridium lagenaria]
MKVHGNTYSSLVRKHCITDIYFIVTARMMPQSEGGIELRPFPCALAFLFLQTLFRPLRIAFSVLQNLCYGALPQLNLRESIFWVGRGVLRDSCISDTCPSSLTVYASSCRSRHLRLRSQEQNAGVFEGQVSFGQWHLCPYLHILLLILCLRPFLLLTFSAGSASCIDCSVLE